MNETLDPKEQLLESVSELLREYWEQYKQPLSLMVLSQKYNKRARALGVELISLLKQDERFLVDMDVKASYRVALRRNVSLSSLITATVKRKGGVMSPKMLKAMILKEGNDIETLNKTIEHLLEAGVLKMTGGEIELLEDADVLS